MTTRGFIPIPAPPGSRMECMAFRAYTISASLYWGDAQFQAPPLSGGIVYELHVGTFTGLGTFDAAIEKLDHLVQLGITHVELMPVAAFEGRHGWGYDGVALFAVHEPYGGPDGLKRFVNAAHAKGLAVLLDVVYNHFGPSGNYTGKFGPYVTRFPSHAVGRRGES
jgi:maltooligosyltrehalose trehalohydrolase